MKSEKPTGNNSRKKKTHKPIKKTETVEPKTETETTTPATETELATIETEPPTTEDITEKQEIEISNRKRRPTPEPPTTEDITEKQEIQISYRRKRPNSASYTEITSITENEKTTMQTHQGITNNSKHKATVMNDRQHNHNLISNQTINFDAIILNGGKNHSIIHPSAKTIKPKNTTAVKGTKARSHSINLLDFNGVPIQFLDVVKRSTKKPTKLSKPGLFSGWSVDE